MAVISPLDPAALYRKTDLSSLNFETTQDLPDLNDVIGQPRAMQAIRLGTGIERDGYNIFAQGPTGVGKRSFVQQFFEQRAAGEPVPPDWVYYYNFQKKNEPCAIRLPAGKGDEFCKDMDHLIEELRSALASAFESDEYRSRRQMLEQEITERQEKSLEGLQEKAKAANFAMIRTPGGLVFAPIREGEVITPEQFQVLPEEDRKQVETTMEGLQNELQTIMQQVPAIQREARERIKELNKSITDFAVGGLIDELQKKYSDIPEIVTYLDNVEADVIENANDLLPQDEEAGGGNPLAALMSRARSSDEGSLNRYKINLLVDNSHLKGAPVIYEDNPSYQNLIGQVEHLAQMGALVTDFTLIKAGALHKANGGYLILDALKLLQNPYSWEALKRALRSRCIRLESIAQMLSLITTTTLEPEPIELDIKIALLGDRMLYYLLLQNDPDFKELFKVEADFDDEMSRNPENQQLYARLIASMVRKYDLKPFDRGAVARVLEHSARIAANSEKLTTHLLPISEILIEANYWAGENGNGAVTTADVDKAIHEQIYRSDRVRQRDQETILEDIYMIDTTGEKVGQLNGLSVMQIGNFAFGRPSRITARVWAGKGNVIDIEREVDLGGPLHSKGVMILSGFLGARYAQKKPLALSASLVFEQSYGGVEGDSASSAELYALLSALADAPIRQSLAVTGSVNQHGQVQAIGGVNEKIEGFFDICKARGLTGEQGVMIPASNVRHLMLRQDVVEAVSAGKFAIYPVEHIDQGIEQLTGVPAGEPDAEGGYPQGTINARVMERLTRFAEEQRDFRRELGETEDKQAEEKPVGEKLK